MASTPKYVRLVERLNRGIVADIDGGSGWSIAGLDVKEVPDAQEEPRAHKFVVDALRRGKLEAAEASEYEVVQAANAVISEAAQFDADAGESVNEAAVRSAVKKGQKMVAEGVAPESEEDEDDGLDDYTRDELVELARDEYDVDLPANVSKADALKAVREAEAARD